MKGPPEGTVLGVPAEDACIGLLEPPRGVPFSPGGSGLFLVSFTVVVDEVGVPWLELLGEWVLPAATKVEVELGAGDEFPDAESFLFFDLLLESLARESCSCTRCLKPFILFHSKSSVPLSLLLPS